MKTESFSLYLIKLIVISSVAVSIGLTAILTGYLLIKQKIISEPQPIKPEISRIEISSDAKSILNADTKEAIFTIADTQKYLKDTGYFYNPDTFQTTNAKYEGDCFIDAALSNNKDKIVFSTGCLPGDLPQAWIGVYAFNYACREMLPECEVGNLPFFGFLISGSGRNFVWWQDDKTITYEADLGLSGLTETRTIDSGTGEILEKKNTPITNNKTEIDEGVYLKDDKIYFYDKVRGFLADDKINIYMGDKILSFTGDIKKLSFGLVELTGWNFYYDTLEISDRFAGPYQIYKKADMNNISYKCNGSLLVTAEGKQLPNYYCKTNNKDFKSQYEFSAANGNGFATGGGYTESWYKLYIKKINGVNYTFNGRLKGGFTDSDDKYSNVKKYNEDYKNLSSKKYLDEILANEENIKLIKGWDKFVENIKFIEKDETADWKTYRNEKYGFEFKYPSNLKLETEFEAEYLFGSNWSINAVTSAVGNSIINIPIYEIRKLDSDAMELRIGASSDAEEVANCLGVEDPKDITNINGIDFTVLPIEGGGAGHYLHGKSFRTVYKKSCFAIEQINFGTGSQGDLDPAQIQNNRNRGADTINKILSTFKFIEK